MEDMVHRFRRFSTAHVIIKDLRILNHSKKFCFMKYEQIKTKKNLRLKWTHVLKS